MKRKSAEIKRIARENLTGHYGLPMGAMVVSQLIVTLPTMFFFLEFDSVFRKNGVGNLLCSSIYTDIAWCCFKYRNSSDCITNGKKAAI